MREALRLQSLFGCVAALLTACHEGPPREAPLTVAAATGLRHVMAELSQVWAKQHGEPPVVVTYGASGSLKKQVEGGAPVDAVVFASAAPLDALVKGGHLLAETRVEVALNSLVLIGPPGSPPLTFETLAQLAEGELIAVGEPGAVPAGEYARALLSKGGVWEALEGRLVFGGDVAAVLAYARRGEVAAAAVYRTDVLGLDDVRVLDEAAAEEGLRIVHLAAAVNARGRSFTAFLASEEARPVWKRFGFRAP